MSTSVADDLLFQMSADLAKMEKQLQRANARFNESAAGIERRNAQTTRKLESMWDASGQRIARSMQDALKGAAAGLAAGAGASAAIAIADTYTRFSNALKVTGLEGESLVRVQDALFASAQRNGVALEPLAQLYGRAAQSATALGASEAQLLQFTDGVTAALRVQGGTAESASGALMQLSQLLASGKVTAEEFNSVNEGARPILQAVADGNAKYGGSVAKLRAEMLAGKLTSAEFFESFLRGAATLEAKAAKAPLTIVASMQTLQNALVLYVGRADESLGASDRLAAGIKLLADNLDDVVDVLVLVATVAGGALAGNMAKATVATVANTAASIAQTRAQIAVLAALSGTSRGALTASVAMTRLSAGMAFFGGPITLAITGVAIAIALLAMRSREADRANESVVETMSGAKPVMDKYSEALDKVEQSSGKARVAALGHAQAMREEAAAAVVAAKALAAKRLAAFGEANARAELAAQARPTDGDLRNARFGVADRVGLVSEATARAAAAAQAAATAAAQGELQAQYQFEDLNTQLDNLLNGRPRNGNGGGPAPAPASGGPRRGGGGGGDSAAEKAAAAAREQAAARARLLEQQTALGDVDFHLDQRDIDAANRALREQLETIRPVSDEVRTLTDLRRNMIDLVDRELGHELDLARLRGDDTTVEQLERELEVRRRIHQFGDSREVAEGDVAEIDQARRQGRFRDAFTNGVMEALKNDGLGAVLQDWWAERTEAGLRKALDRAADWLFEFLDSASSGGGKGGGGKGGGWGDIARSAASVFGGFKASGGPVQPGFTYIAGEKGPEPITVGGPGRVMTTNNFERALNGAGQLARGADALRLVVTPSPYFDVAVERVAAPLANQAALQGAALGAAGGARIVQRQSARTARRRMA